MMFPQEKEGSRKKFPIQDFKDLLNFRINT